MPLAAIAVAVIAVVILAAIVRQRRARSRRIAFHRAATDDRTSGQLEELLRSGPRIDVQDSEGNTALHLAHYRMQHESIRRLIEFGADENLRNKLGLLPEEMGRLAGYEDLFRRTAEKLMLDGSWADGDARPGFQELRRAHPRFYQPGLSRAVTGTGQMLLRRRLLLLGVKIGHRSSERLMVELLNGYGDKEMAEDFLNCGSSALATGAERWAKARGYRIHRYGSGARPLRWGRF